VKIWLNAVRYYLLSWVHLFQTYNGKDSRKWPNSINIRIPIPNWKKYYAQRKELLKQAAATYTHYQDYLSKYIEECPNCGQETYMKVGLTSLYRCYTCNDTPKEWK
jgi:uncharacterized protein YeaO (DUF488 family)